MSLSAWITSIAVGIVLYGGLWWCIAIAIRRGRTEQKEHPDARWDSGEE